MTKRKQNTVILPKDMFNRTDLKSLSQGFIREIEQWFGPDVGIIMKTSEGRWALNKSIKELKAKIRGAVELKNRMFAKLKSRMKKLNVWSENGENIGLII